MPDDVRGKVKQALDEAIAYGNQIALEKAVEDKQKIVDSGRSEVIDLSSAERAQWVEVMKPVWKKFEGEIGKDLIDAAYASNRKL
jgi:C4-dicarboxylate-binding protein DctP